MESVKYTYTKYSNYYLVGNEIKDEMIYENLGNKNVFILIKNKKIILKIKTNKKFKFLRIHFKILNLENTWFGKYPNSEDLLVLKEVEMDKHYNVVVFRNQWQHKFMLLDLIKSNPNIYL